MHLVQISSNSCFQESCWQRVIIKPGNECPVTEHAKIYSNMSFIKCRPFPSGFRVLTFSSGPNVSKFWISGPWFNINMSSYQYMKSHCGDKTILLQSYLHNGISYTGKMISIYWIGAQSEALHLSVWTCKDNLRWSPPGGPSVLQSTMNVMWA